MTTDADKFNFTLLGRWLPWAASGFMAERWMGTMPIEAQFEGNPKPVATRALRVTSLRELILLDMPVGGPVALARSAVFGWLPLRLLVVIARLFACERFVALHDGCPYRGFRIDSRWLLCVAETRMLRRKGGAILPDLLMHADSPLAVA